MLSFIKYVLMIEAKVDDLVSKHPEHEEAIRAYHAADPTPTKKFLPWLTKQHIAGNVTPNDVRLGSTLQHFDKVKHQLDKKDHSSYHYNDLANTVGDRVKAKLEADTKKNAVETIHKEPNGITAQHIKTKEASQDLYGGGANRGGKKGCAQGTSWCVSARSKGNLFGQYGHMYTIHDPNDDYAPYAVHPFHHGGSTITNRYNDYDMEYKHALEDSPHLKNAVNSIMKHSAKHIDKMIKSNNEDEIYHGISHPHATPEHIDKALDTNHNFIGQAAAKHPNATPANIDKALNSEHFLVRSNAASNRNATAENITKALNLEDRSARSSAIHNPNANAEHITKALNDEHPFVRELAIQHPKANAEHITKALRDKSVGVRRAAISNPNATPDHITKAMNDKDLDVRRAAIQHPNATSEHITKALNDEATLVRRDAIQHLKANAEHITKALNDGATLVRKDAVKHPNATPEHIKKALNDEESGVRNAAMDRQNSLK
jgi:hypothetical protein